MGIRNENGKVVVYIEVGGQVKGLANGIKGLLNGWLKKKCKI